MKQSIDIWEGGKGDENCADLYISMNKDDDYKEMQQWCKQNNILAHEIKHANIIHGPYIFSLFSSYT